MPNKNLKLPGAISPSGISFIATSPQSAISPGDIAPKYISSRTTSPQKDISHNAISPSAISSSATSLPKDISQNAISPRAISSSATSSSATSLPKYISSKARISTPVLSSNINIGQQLYIPRYRIPKIILEDKPGSVVSIDDNGSPSTPYTISSIISPDYSDTCSDEIISKHGNEQHIDMIDNLIKSRALLDIFYRIKSVSQNSYHTIGEIIFIKKIQTIINDIECQLKKIFYIFKEENHKCLKDDIACILKYFLNNFKIDTYLKEQIFKEYNALTEIQQQKYHSGDIPLLSTELDLNDKKKLKSYIDVLIKLKLRFIYHPNINEIKVIINFLLLSNNFMHPKILTLFKQINESSTVGGNFFLKGIRAMIGKRKKKGEEESEFSKLDELDEVDESIDGNMKRDTIEILDDIICACYQKYYRLHYKLVYKLDSKQIDIILSEIRINSLHITKAETIDEIYQYVKYIGLLEMIKIYITTCEEFIIIPKDDFDIIIKIFSKSSFNKGLQKDLIDIYYSFILNKERCLGGNREDLNYCDKGYKKNFNKEINIRAEFLIDESNTTIHNFYKKINKDKFHTEFDEIKDQCNDGYNAIVNDNLVNDESKICYCSKYGTMNNDCKKCMICNYSSETYIIFTCDHVMCLKCVLETIIETRGNNNMFGCVCGATHSLKHNNAVLIK